jgi:hypothetical protein
MFAGWKRRLGLGLAALLALGVELATPALAQDSAYGLQPDGKMIVSPQVAKVIGDYLNLVNHRFGALAVSRDGKAAGFYICQSRLWKNCDDYSLEDSFQSIPSGKLAGPLALSQCRNLGSGDCVLLFTNDRWQRPFALAK